MNTRRETIIDSEVREDEFTAVAEVVLNDIVCLVIRANFFKGRVGFFLARNTTTQLSPSLTVMRVSHPIIFSAIARYS